ncbi:hypothetical protein [Geomonas ferrireducens]|uniref:hypothetical protein n=1 Tax=Geomonas ferrireducens TaxID=2570227 RepID=UPI0010A85290|nr:hypothetical protein [Geomonas ferrireducens]
MRAEVVIESSYEAAWCELKGLSCRMVPSLNSQETEYIFTDNKTLRETRRQFSEDVDLQEFIEVHRRLKWSVKKALQDRARN